MIRRELKLRLSKTQEAKLEEYLWYGTGIYNWAIKKIEHDAQGGIYYSEMEFQNLLAYHSRKMGMPSHMMQALLSQAHNSWQRCFKKIAKKPRLKGQRNKLKALPLPDPFKSPSNNKITIPSLKSVRYIKQELPEGKIKNGTLIKRASGWYLSLVIDALPNIATKYKHKGDNEIGIDPGFSSLINISDGEKVAHPREFEADQKRLAQAQRGHDKKLASRIHERIKNRKKDRNHKLSRRLVEENSLIAFSKDNIKGIAKRFGKSVQSSNHYQLRQFLNYKSSICGVEYVEVNGAFSTKTCSACGEIADSSVFPKGLAGLKVREWVCKNCGSSHDRDTNASINTLISALGRSVEVVNHVT
jgi:IS605 OrfB family transposase